MMASHRPNMEAMEALKTHDIAKNRQHILDLPAEIREQIWIHAVTDWTRSISPRVLEKQPIRVDYLNRPLPPALTRVNRQLYTETLHLYYAHNIFECWRPFIHSPVWAMTATLMYWLNSLGSEKASWINHIVLLYKDESELEEDFLQALAVEGYSLRPEVVSFRQELSEYELCYEQLGLPKKFSKQTCKWLLN